MNDTLYLVLYLLQIVFAQEDSSKSDLQMELSVTDEQRVIIFATFIIATVGIFLYLARDIILRKKTKYDESELESQRDKTYEKYHSDWHDDYEDLGAKSKNKFKEEFRKKMQKEELPDYYQVLGIPRNSTQEEIKRRFRQLAKELHPDRNKGKNAQEEMVRINEAYEVLSDKELKEKYDRFLGIS